ncbi:baeRF3 domain-containing protein [Pseudomonas sp. Z3-6]|uniref:baeRF3 domain-containing protein n=1 Tax=Pseudomonas sp. Z3-6 TaxID=2817411 RepID=UPI003DA8D1CE
MTAHQPFNRQVLAELLAFDEQPSLSLYMPTHRTFPERSQDPIRYKNLVRDLQAQLEQQHPDLDGAPLLQSFHALVDDQDFWNSNRDGIAVFGARDYFKVIAVNQRLPQRAVANSHPYLKPLLRLVQSTDRYQALCLTRNEVWLYEGSSEQLEKIELAEQVPRNQNEALGDELTPGNQQGFPNGFSRSGERGDAMMHEAAGGGKQDEINLDRERFFRVVDKAILQYHSQPSGLPMILVALPENQAVFRAVSHNSQLLPQGIEIDPSRLGVEALRVHCSKLMAHSYADHVVDSLNRYGIAVGQGRALDNLADIAKAAREGRVALLLVEAERQVPGQLDLDKGRLLIDESGDELAPDVLDELILAVTRQGGEVVVIPPEHVMPTGTGAAAVCRF